MEKNKIEDAKQLGFIARMNHQPRIPIQDKKMYWVWHGKKSESVKQDVSTFFAAWLEGWDECNLEYVKTPHKTKS